jgi:hypothetical protein
MEPHEGTLDGLYQARDALADVIEQMRKMQPADLVSSLSCYRVAGLQVLENYSAFVDDVSHLLEHAPTTSPHVQESRAQLRSIRELLYDAVAKAEDILPTVDQLRLEEMRAKSTNNDWP